MPHQYNLKISLFVSNTFSMAFFSHMELLNRTHIPMVNQNPNELLIIVVKLCIFQMFPIFFNEVKYDYRKKVKSIGMYMF